MPVLPIVDDTPPTALTLTPGDLRGFFDPAFFDPAFFDTGGWAALTLTPSATPSALTIV